MTRGERLARALDAWKGGGVLAFQREMEQRANSDPSLQGITYQSIRKYLRDLAIPPLRFMEVAAEVLGVRLAWLVAEQGEMTEVQQAGMEAVEGEARPDYTAVVFAAVEDLFPPFATVSGAARLAVWEAVFTQFLNPTLADIPGEGAEKNLRLLAAAQDVGRILRGPLEVLHPTYLSGEPMWRASQYVQEVCLLIEGYAPRPYVGVGRALVEGRKSAEDELFDMLAEVVEREAGEANHTREGDNG